MSRKFTCNVCNGETATQHKKCRPPEISVEEHRFNFLIHNYPELMLETDIFIKDLYINGEYSFPDFKSEFGISSKKIVEILDYFHIPRRDATQSTLTTRYRNKQAATNLERYGTINVLSRGSPIFEKRNNTVIERYGVDNVRKATMVKEQITKTMLERYGVKRTTNVDKLKETRKNFSDEKLKEIYDKFIATINNRTPERRQEIYNTRSLISKNWWATVSAEFFDITFLGSGKMNKPESRISAALTNLGISFEYSKFIKRRQFDFRIANIIIEMNGDFWHANPEVYAPSDILNHPGKSLTAQQLWDRDKIKKEIAESYGYTVIYLWEKDLNDMNDIDLEECILQIINENIISDA